MLCIVLVYYFCLENNIEIYVLINVGNGKFVCYFVFVGI